MKNTLQLIGTWLASKFNKIEAIFSTKEELKDHNTSTSAHKDIRGRIDNIIDGTTIVGRSESATIIGTKTDGYTKSQIERMLDETITSVSLDPDAYILSFHYRDGKTVHSFDLPIEMTVKDGRYDDDTKELVLVLVSGQETRIPASGLVKVYIGKESATTTVSIDERTGGITVDVKEGSITKEHLAPALRDEIQKLENLPENAGSDFNILYVNFEDIEDYDDLLESDELCESLDSQFQKIEDYNKPFQIVLTDGKRYVCDEVSSYVKSTTVQVVGYLPFEYASEISYNRLLITYRFSSEQVSTMSLTYKEKDNGSYFLRENGDGSLGVTEGKWDDFYEDLLAGKHPVVYLNPSYKDNLWYPASYSFVVNDGKMDLNVDISYPVTENGVAELWTERRSFTDFKGTSSLIEYTKTKTTLGSRILVVDLDLIPEGGNTTYADFLTNITEQVKNYDADTKLKLYFKCENTLYECDKVTYKVDDFTTIKLATITSAINDNIIGKKGISGSSVTIFCVYNDTMADANIQFSNANYDGIIFLTENGDGSISTVDKGWDDFSNAIGKGKHPAVYLKSSNSNGVYCPASYEFTKYAFSSKFSCSMEISYHKTTDGVNELWKERRTFENGVSSTSQYSYELTKLPLGVPVSVVSDYPTDLSGYPDGSIFIKNA